MRRAVALFLALSLVAGCFPHNAHHRTIAEIVEGGVAAGGVVIEGFAQSGADCDMTMHAPGEPPVACRNTASLEGGVGVALILAGLLGFMATISTAADDDDKPKPIEIKAKPEPAPTPIVVPTAPPPPEPPVAPPAPPPQTEP